MKPLFNRERKSQALFGLSGLCILLIVGCLALSASMGLGLVPSSVVKLVGIVVVVGLLVMAALWLLLEALSAKQAAGTLHAPEMSTLTFPPPAVSSGRRGLVVRIK
jgi:hypothetical protein